MIRGLFIFIFILAGSCSSTEDEVQETQAPDMANEVLEEPAADASSDTTAPGASDGEASEPPLKVYDFSERAAQGQVRAGVIGDVGGLLKGPKEEGKLGDIRMDNAKVAFVLAGVRPASGYSFWGGNVIDGSAWREGEGFAPDYFGELFFAWNLDVFRPESVEVLDDGSTSGKAHVRFKGRTDLFDFADSALGALVNLDPPDMELVYDYTLGPEDDALTLSITLENPRKSDYYMEWPLLMSNSGDGVFNFVPGHGFADLNGEPLPYFGLSGRRVSYAFISELDDIKTIYGYAGVSIFQVGDFEIPKESSMTRTFYILMSDRGPTGLDEGVRRLREDSEPAYTLSGSVKGAGGDKVDQAWVVVRQKNDESVVTIAPVEDDGSYRLDLTDGAYYASAHVEGHAASEPLDVNVASADLSLSPLIIPAPARVTIRVTEVSTQEATPARVTFVRRGDTVSAYAPDTLRPVRKSWSGDTSAVAYVTGSEETVTLPGGDYTVTASRGPTHEIDQRELSFSAGESTELEMSVEQVIDTTGWLSGDFHIHAYWSPDSYVPWTIRARQAATEDLDLPILTEHVYVAGLQGAIESTGVSEHAIGVVGQEVTTFSYGHFNAFPLELRKDERSGGAVYPHDKEPVELFEAIRAQHAGDEVIQINHPRGSQISGYFSYVGLDADADTVVRPSEWTLNWDAIEVFNGGCGIVQEVYDWIGLTNHGHRKTLASGSDSHGEDGLIGTPRNWIQVAESSVRADHQALVEPIRQRRSFISCGPFVRFEAVDLGGATLAGLGESVQVDALGDAHFRVRVEAPSWMIVNEVRLWENGQVIRVEDITSAFDPVLRFDAVWSVTPLKDAWYAVEVVGSGSMAPVTRSGPPYALTNPIEVDQDRDGEWTPPGSSE